MAKDYIISQEDAIDKQFGRWIRGHRRDILKLGVVEAAELLDMPYVRLIDIENGHKPITTKEARRLAERYKIKLSVVLARAVANF